MPSPTVSRAFEHRKPFLGFVLLTAGLVATTASTATASELIDRNASDVQLRVDRTGTALLTYRSGGAVKHVVASGAVDALAPTPGRAQVAFRIERGGGASANACRPAAPPLHWLVAACQAPDGSFWAAQSWQRGLPNYGVAPDAEQGAWELRLSHWTGAVPALSIRFGWTYRRYQQLYGTFAFHGQPVFGFHSTRFGQPLDDFGRNVYVDTFGSAYGAGWKRENSFLTHQSRGGFCYGFYPHGSHPSGNGSRYRATVIGPGVAPDAYWEGSGPTVYDRGTDTRADADMQALLGSDQRCRPH